MVKCPICYGEEKTEKLFNSLNHITLEKHQSALIRKKLQVIEIKTQKAIELQIRGREINNYLHFLAKYY